MSVISLFYNSIQLVLAVMMVLPGYIVCFIQILAIDWWWNSLICKPKAKAFYSGPKTQASSTLTHTQQLSLFKF